MDWEKIKESRAFRWGKDIAFVVIIFAVVMAYQTWSHVDTGSPAPAFSLQTLAGGDVVSTESLQGKPTLVYFWAPWCGVCEASSHNVDAVKEAVGDKYNVVSVALEYSSVEAVQDFVDRNEAGYPVLLGNSGVTRDYFVEAFPTIYILGADGTVESSVVGYTTEFGIRARLWWSSIW